MPIKPPSRLRLIIDNKSLNDFRVLWPGTYTWEDTLTWEGPADAEGMTSGVSAGSFQPVDGKFGRSIKCASVYETPNPWQKLFIFVTAPHRGDVVVKVRFIPRDTKIDEILVEDTEGSDKYTHEDELICYQLGQMKTIKVSASLAFDPCSTPPSTVARIVIT